MTAEHGLGRSSRPGPVPLRGGRAVTAGEGAEPLAHHWTDGHSRRADVPRAARVLDALARLLAVVRPWTSVLHERLWRVTDGTDPRTAALMSAAGGHTSHVLRTARVTGWGSGAGVGLLLAAAVDQVGALAAAASGRGHLDLLAGRTLVVAGLVAFAVDVLQRLASAPVVAVGRDGASIGFPSPPPAPRPHGVTRLIRSTRAHVDVDAVPWGDVAALVHVRTVPGRAQVGVRLRTPLLAPWPRPTPAGVPPEDVRVAGFGTVLLTRDVAALSPRELGELAAVAEHHRPGTPLEDVDLAALTRHTPGGRC